MRSEVALILGLALAAACATSKDYVDFPGPGPPTQETRRSWFEGRKELRRLYRVLVYESGFVEKHGLETEWYRSGVRKMEREWDHGEPTGRQAQLTRIRVGHHRKNAHKRADRKHRTPTRKHR